MVNVDNSWPRQSEHARRLPAHYHANMIITHPGERGQNTILLDLLNSPDDCEIDIECNVDDLQLLAQSFVEVDTFVGASLHDPINDPSEKDPFSIQHAKSSIYWSYWLAAIYEELESPKAKGVYEEVQELPPNQKAVGCKWVLRIKRDRDGLISRFKARLVAKGFTQIPGQDYNYTFAPVAQWESICTVLTIAAEHDMELRQIDVKTAYLNGPLDEEIYMHKPSITGSGYWRLRKGLYGLKQSGRQWYLELNTKLESIGFKQTQSNWSVYYRYKNGNCSIITTSVDNMLIAANSVAKADLVIAQLKSLFDLTDNSKPTFHLACGITHDRANRTIKIDQLAYTESIL
jgi:hypothetical protein